MTEQSALGVAIYGKDIFRLSAFYTGVLGLQVRESEPGFIVLEADTVELILVALPQELAETITITVPPEVREDTPLKPLFPVKSIEAARAQAEALGGGLKSRENEWRFHNLRVCDGYDPEGNVFQVRELAQAEINLKF